MNCGYSNNCCTNSYYDNDCGCGYEENNCGAVANANNGCGSRDNCGVLLFIIAIILIFCN